MHSLNLLNFIYILVFDIEKALKKIQISDLRTTRIEHFLHPLPSIVGEGYETFIRKFSGILQKPKFHLCHFDTFEKSHLTKLKIALFAIIIRADIALGIADVSVRKKM